MMKKTIHILLAVLLAVMMLIVAAPVSADDYPTTNINGIVPWGAAGPIRSAGWRCRRPSSFWANRSS